MPVSIIPTKLIIPKRAPGVIRRLRLIDYVHENLGRKLLLVTAPAGYGKTTLLADFANDSEFPARRNEVQKLGAAACIKKPIGPRDLVASIRAILNGNGKNMPRA